jgi:hypothetical protein
MTTYNGMRSCDECGTIGRTLVTPHAATDTRPRMVEVRCLGCDALTHHPHAVPGVAYLPSRPRPAPRPIGRDDKREREHGTTDVVPIAAYL